MAAAEFQHDSETELLKIMLAHRMPSARHRGNLATPLTQIVTIGGKLLIDHRAPPSVTDREYPEHGGRTLTTRCARFLCTTSSECAVTDRTMTRQYYLVLKGKSVGPLRSEHFVALANEGLITHRSLVREHNTGEAIPIGRHPVIARTVFGKRAPLVKVLSIMEDWRHRPVVGIAAGVAIVILATVN